MRLSYSRVRYLIIGAFEARAWRYIFSPILLDADAMMHRNAGDEYRAPLVIICVLAA